MNNQELEIFKIEIDETAKSTMLEMSRWTKFLAIMGFIFMGLMFFIGLILGATYSNINGGDTSGTNIGIVVAFLVVLIFAGVYFYPVFALLKYSSLIKAAMRTSDKDQFNRALRYQKNMFKYLGILAIITVSLYGIALVLQVIAAVNR